MKTVFFATLFFIIFTGCIDGKIEITNEYVLNQKWTKGKNGEEANSIAITRMKVKKDSLLYPLEKLSQDELLEDLEVDSSFSYVAVIKTKPDESYQTKKIYFNRDNGFNWSTRDGEQKLRYIGNLQKNNWYEINGLTDVYFIVYVDSLNNVHPFTINVATNF